VENDEFYAAGAELVFGELYELFGKTAAAEAGIDVDVQDVSALRGCWVRGVRRPVDEEEADAGDDGAVFFGKKAKIGAGGETRRKPVAEERLHLIEDGARCTVRGKHQTAMAADDSEIARLHRAN